LQIDVDPREPVETLGGFRASVTLLRRNRNFRRLYLASVISLGGDWFLLIALFGLMLDLTGQAIAVAFTIAAQDLTYFLASPFAGVLADRVDRRRLMIACDLARAVLVLGFLVVRTEDLAWLVYVLLAATAVFAAAFEPASMAAMPNLVDERDLSVANALSGSLWGTMLAVGGALGGGGCGGVRVRRRDRRGLGLVRAVGAADPGDPRTFAEDRAVEERPSLRQDTVETVRYARKDHRVLALLAVKFGWGVAGGVLVLLPILALGRFHAGEIGLGLLMAARGVGALIGPFLGRSLAGPQDRRLFGAIGGALATFGVGYVLLGLAPALVFAMGAVLVAHIGGGAQWTLSSYGLQRVVPDRIRGRIFAVDGMLVTLTFGLSAILTGWLADVFTAETTALAMGGVALVWAIVWTLLTGDVRRATMLEGCGPAPELVSEPAELPG
jgi:MFS family permease